MLDLKNFITPISTFLVHTDGCFAIASVEREVHTAAERSVSVMTEYVRESLFLASRLRRNSKVGAGARIELSRELTAARAAPRSRGRVFPRKRPFIDDAVLVQRLLANLMSNAIDAAPDGGHVPLRRRDPAPWVRVKVVDGVRDSTENLGRVFDPYFTTKQFGDDIRGFGLG